MFALDMKNMVYHESKEPGMFRSEQCKTCRHYNLKGAVCTRYNMISRPEQTCKSHKREEK